MKQYMEKLRMMTTHLPELLIIFFSPALAQIGLVLLAIIADTVTGIWASTKEGVAFSSKKFSPIWLKMTNHVFLILLAHGIEVIFDINHARTIVAIGLVGSELISIDENMKRATGKSIFEPIARIMGQKKSDKGEKR